MQSWKMIEVLEKYDIAHVLLSAQGYSFVSEQWKMGLRPNNWYSHYFIKQIIVVVYLTGVTFYPKKEQ